MGEYRAEGSWVLDPNGVVVYECITATRANRFVNELNQLLRDKQTLNDELLRVRTAGHGAAHELDNIAIECGLGHSPKAGVVAEHVRQLLRDVRVLQEVVKECERWSGFGNLKTTELFEKARNPGALTRWGGGGR